MGQAFDQNLDIENDSGNHYNIPINFCPQVTNHWTVCKNITREVFYGGWQLEWRVDVIDT